MPVEELDDHGICHYLKDGLLMRKYCPPEARPESRPGEAWRIIHHIVLPQCYRTEVINMAHDIPLVGHLGVNKTNERIIAHFSGLEFGKLWHNTVIHARCVKL